MNGYVFYCSRCRFDHAGECAPAKTKVTIEVNSKAAEKSSDLIASIQALVKALEAGGYNAAPTKLTQGCSHQVEDLDLVMSKVTFKESHIKLRKPYQIDKSRNI